MPAVPGTAAPTTAPAGSGPSPRPGHLHQLDVARVITFLCVIAAHTITQCAPRTDSTSWAFELLLHFTRVTFFALNAFVLIYSQRGRSFDALRFWRRRLGILLVPYLIWTVVYDMALTIQESRGLGETGISLARHLIEPYYHLYFMFLIMQVYLLYPLLRRLIAATAGHHAVLLGASLILQILINLACSGDRPGGGAGWWYDLATHNQLCVVYQLYIVAGAVAGFHAERFHSWVEHYRPWLLPAAVLASAPAIGWYVHDVRSGTVPGSAAIPYRIEAIPAYLAITVLIYAAGTLWSDVEPVRRDTRAGQFVRWAAAASFGVYLVHPLVLKFLLPHWELGLGGTTFALPVRLAAAFAITVVLAFTFTGLIMRTPLSQPFAGRARRPGPKSVRARRYS